MDTPGSETSYLTTYEWILFADNEVTIWFNRTLSTISCIHHAAVLIVLLFINIKSNELSKEHKYRRLLLINTLLTIFCFFVFQIMVVMISYIDIIFEDPSLLECKFLWLSFVFVYWISKYGLWLYAVIRLILVFYTVPSMQYTKKSLLIINVILLTTVILIEGIILPHTFTNIIFTNSHIPVCISYYPIWLVPSCGALDCFVSVLLLLLFYRRLKILLNKKDDAELTYLVRKYFILLLVEIGSTNAAAFGSFTPCFLSFASFDSVVNTWCLLLFDGRNDKIYLKLFGKCAKKPEPKSVMEFEQFPSTTRTSSPNKMETQLSEYIDSTSS